MPNPPRSRRWSLALGLGLLALLLFVAQSKKPHEQNWFDRVLLWTTAPLQRALTWTLEGGAGLWHRYVWLVGVEEENERLRSEGARLRSELADRAALAAENQRLRDLVDLRSRPGAQAVVGARVIALGTSPATRIVRIDAGAEDGVRAGDAVVAAGGLVGRISGVTGGSSEVILLVDSRSAVDALVLSSRARGIVRGRGGDLGLMVDHLVRTAEIQPGDVMVTSGLGGVFPGGLSLGAVASVTAPRAGVFREAELRPAVDFGGLEEVLVVRAAGRAADPPAAASGPADGAPRGSREGAP